MKLQHFRLEEFACRCGRKECDAQPMQPYYLYQVEGFRVAWGRPMDVISGARCRWWNKHPKVKGALDSRHMYGDAGDYRVHPAERYEFVALAIAHGFSGIGVAKTFIHLDARPLGVGDYKRLWTY